MFPDGSCAHTPRAGPQTAPTVECKGSARIAGLSTKIELEDNEPNYPKTSGDVMSPPERSTVARFVLFVAVWRPDIVTETPSHSKGFTTNLRGRSGRDVGSAHAFTPYLWD